MSASFLKRETIAAAIFGSLALLCGCAPSVGDSCESNVECPSGATCDVTAPRGYCTFEGCDIDSCPDGTVCVEFDEDETFCMKYCESDTDCRRGYVCRGEPGPAGYCYVAP